MRTFGVADLEVRYGRARAVCGVSFEARPGSIVAVVGGDGAGKTTVLRALAGVVGPTSGSVRRPSDTELGYVPADSGIYRDLTTEENLRFVGAAYGLKAGRLRERMGAVLDVTDLGTARERLAGNLSGGMRQKLALGCALLHEPALLVLDEPTTGVDPVSRAELWRTIARSAAGGAAVVFSSPYIDEAERAEHVVVLDDGRVLLEGSPGDLVSSVPGTLRDVPQRPDHLLAYRRGARFRAWDPSATNGDDVVAPDLHDAVTIAALRARGPEHVA